MTPGLTDGQRAELHGSPLFNDDLAPVPPSRRTWRLGTFAALWISMSACIPTYMLASSLIGDGMSWWQAPAPAVTARAASPAPRARAGVPRSPR